MMTFDIGDCSDGDVRRALRTALVEIGFGGMGRTGKQQVNVERRSGAVNFGTVGAVEGQYRGAFSEDRNGDRSPGGAG